MSGVLDRRALLRLAAGGLVGGAAACAGRRRGPDDAAPATSGTTSGSSSGTATPATPPPSTAAAEALAMLTRPIPRTGEALPVIGLGTWQVFDVADTARARGPLIEVMRTFLAAGGRLVDSSPMYGEAEEVTGAVVAAAGVDAAPFLATKVWTSGKQPGIEQMQRSMRRMRTARMDLMQVHNLVDWRTHLPILREWKQSGLIRYLGVTHYQLGELATIERLMRDETLDFVQVPYSIANRTAEKRLLPAAIATGTAVLVMTPFESGELFVRVKGKPLPAWAAELGCATWAQVFLKFIVGHPAVNAPLPATSRPAHMADNVAAGRGPLPDERQRARMAADLGL